MDRYASIVALLAGVALVSSCAKPGSNGLTAVTPVDTAVTVKNEITSNGGTMKHIAFTEWNMWAKDAKQQVSNTSGLFAIIVQAEVIKNKYGLAARWDLLNGWEGGNDHGLFSNGGSTDDPRWNPRPSFYYMYYFQKCIGDRLVSAAVPTSSAIKAYSSTYSSGQMNVTLLNTASTPQAVEVKTKNFRFGSRYHWYTLEGSSDNGEFSRKVLVNGNGPTGVAGGPASYASLKAQSALILGGIKVTVLAFGAVCMLVDKR